MNLGKILDVIESRWSLLVLSYGLIGFLPASLVAYLASVDEYLSKFGAVVWVGVFLITALIVSATVFLFAQARKKFSESRLYDLRVLPSDAVNPLDDTFHRRRIKLSDLVDPATNTISNKTFVDCELVGPATLLMTGGVHMSFSGIVDCNIISLKPNTQLSTISVFPISNITMTRGKIYGCTILVTEEASRHFDEMGAPILSYRSSDF